MQLNSCNRMNIFFSAPKSSCGDNGGRSATSSGLLEEAQDFSMKSNKPHQQHQQPPQQQSSEQSQQNKSKLDDMLSKLMQRKNCVSTFLLRNTVSRFIWVIFSRDVVF